MPETGKKMSHIMVTWSWDTATGHKYKPVAKLPKCVHMTMGGGVTLRLGYNFESIVILKVTGY